MTYKVLSLTSPWAHMVVHFGETPGAAGVLQPKLLQHENTLSVRISDNEAVTVEQGADNPNLIRILQRLVPGAEYTHSVMVHIFGMPGFLDHTVVDVSHELHAHYEQTMLAILKLVQ